MTYEEVCGEEKEKARRLRKRGYAVSKKVLSFGTSTNANQKNEIYCMSSVENTARADSAGGTGWREKLK